MATVNHTVQYCDRCGKDVSTRVRGQKLEQGLIRLSWRGTIQHIDGFGANLCGGEVKDSIELCNSCFRETEKFLLNKHYAES